MSARAYSAVIDTDAPAVVRRLVVTWQHPVSRSISPVGMLSFDGDTCAFVYIRGALSVPGFRPFLGFPDLGRYYHSSNLFPLFAQRAMTPRRPDFTRWVTHLGLSEDASPWEQIARSGGRRRGDTIQLFPVPNIAGGRLHCDFLVHGVRHVLDRGITIGDAHINLDRERLEHELARLRPGDPLLLRDQPDNPVNAHAILTTTINTVPLGWVPDLLVEEIHRVPDRHSVQVIVEHLNGPDAGWHLRLLAHLSADVPDCFEAFTGPRWEPLATVGA